MSVKAYLLAFVWHHWRVIVATFGVLVWALMAMTIGGAERPLVWFLGITFAIGIGFCAGQAWQWGEHGAAQRWEDFKNQIESDQQSRQERP